MKKHILLMSLALIATTSFAQSKLDAQSRLAIRQLAAKAAAQAKPGTSGTAAADEQLQVMVRMIPGHTPSEISLDGVEIGVTRSEFGVVSLPLSRLDDLNALPEVQSIAYKQAVRPCLADANADTGADRAHAGTGLKQPYTGKGVVVGVIDNWLDPNHIMFRDAATGDNRVKLMFPSSGAILATPSQITAYKPSDFDKSSDHGTHVAGIAAGNYSDGTFSCTGVAPGADIVMGTLAEEIAPFMNRVETFVRYAKKQGKRLVINMSYAPVGGPHDGTSAIAAYIDKVSEQENVTFCLASGNDGAGYHSWSHTFAADMEQTKAFLATTTGAIDIWSNDSRDFGVGFVVYDTENKRYVTNAVQLEMYGDNAVDLSSVSGFSQYFSGTITSSSYIDRNNYHYNAYVQLDVKKTSSNSNFVLGMIIAGQNGMSIIANTTGSPTFVPASADNPEWGADVSRAGTANDYGSGTEPIVVGSYTTRESGAYANGTTYNLARYGFSDKLGDVSSFTSYGSYATGRSYPHILAPGAFIESSMSTYYMENTSLSSHNAYTHSVEKDDKKYYFTSYLGTSMASPYMAGAAAVWLEANPSLKPTEIRDIAMQTARRDEAVLKADQTQCGAGKLDVYEGLKEALRRAETAVQKIDSSRDFLFRATSPDAYDFFVAGATAVQATLYNLQGEAVRTASASGDSVSLSTAGLPSGVYAAKVMGGKKCHSVKVVVD